MSHPTWAYRKGPQGVESRLFLDGIIPAGEGWVDSPAKCVDPPKPAVKTPKK